MNSKSKFKIQQELLRKPGVSVIILVFSLLTILGLSAFVIDLGIILNQRYEMQKTVESAALLAASEYEVYCTNSAQFSLPSEANVKNNAAGHYNELRTTNQILLKSGAQITPTVTVNDLSRSVMVEATMNAPTYFLGVIGIKSIQIQAKAAAIATPVFLSEKFPKPAGSIVNGIAPGVYRDTYIRPPLGGAILGAAPTNNQNYSFNNIYGRPDSKALSLGPAGFITTKLPQMAFDGKGFDFVVYERGSAEGYYVYAGIDSNPQNPYINASKPGGGIDWINVSCTGVPLYVRPKEIIGAYKSSVVINGGASVTDYKFYGSGMFDLGIDCGGGIYNGSPTATDAEYRINNVKYIKIIDDNVEDGFLIQPKFNLGGTNPIPAAVPMLIPGEHSSFTPGADIDAIEVLHHSRLISVNEFMTGDSVDGDGLLSTVEKMYGTKPDDSDSDIDMLEDLYEVYGYQPTNSGGGITVNDTPAKVLAPALIKEYFNTTISPPTMTVEL